MKPSPSLPASKPSANTESKWGNNKEYKGWTACQAFAKLMPDNQVEYLEGDLSPAEVKEKGLNGVDYHYQVFFDHPEWVEEAHKLGMIVNTWTVDKEEDIRRVLELGVDQVTTNEPELAQRLIAEFMAKKK